MNDEIPILIFCVIFKSIKYFALTNGVSSIIRVIGLNYVQTRYAVHRTLAGADLESCREQSLPSSAFFSFLVSIKGCERRDAGPVLGNLDTLWRRRIISQDKKRMFAANFLNKLSSKYWDNVQRLRNGAENNFDDDSYYDTT